MDDIFNHRTKLCYRLGTVVLHQGKDSESGGKVASTSLMVSSAFLP
ncbi:hypothetical protein [Vibrio parahaemolyticus]|nr:hypothetical protein [Vibrio parahaemolyticus]